MVTKYKLKCATQFELKGEHVLVVEKVLGKILPAGVEVHHVDGNELNNKNSNLVVCPNHMYHHLLHTRTKALQECGNPDYRKCFYCKQWDDPKNMVAPPNCVDINFRHKKCHNAYYREYYRRRTNKGLSKTS